VAVVAAAVAVGVAAALGNWITSKADWTGKEKRGKR